MATPLTGYRHPLYIESLSDFGTPIRLPLSGGGLLVRTIPGSSRQDASGAYPLFSCADWGGLAADLAEIGTRLLSVTLVADPFGGFEASDLSSAFDSVSAFKQHYVADLTLPAETRISSHHRRVARRSLRHLEVGACEDPSRWLDEWCGLYEHTIQRHSLRGIKAFSRGAFEKQLQVPGLVMFRATHQGQVVAIHLWYQQDDVAYGHLAGMNDMGYRMAASYALYSLASDWFTGRVTWLDLGGLPDDGGRAGGLDYFKAGWATATRPAWLCTRVCDRAAYDELVASRRHSRTQPTGYFPAYRAAEQD